MTLGLLAVSAVLRAADPPKEFTATAEMTTSQGTRQMPLTLVVSRPLSPEQAMPLREVLEKGGQQALQAAIRDGNRGRFSLGALEYPIDLVVAQPLEDGVRYVAITTRQLKYDEVEQGSPSLDYPFAVVAFEVPEFGVGSGELYPQAALSISAEGRVQVEQYGGAPGKLREVRKR